MAETTFNAKLMAAMQLMGNPVRDTKGHNYKYAQLDQVMEVIKPALYANGLAVRQGTKLDGGFLILETFVFDENEERAMDVRTIERNHDPQKQGSYETYMRRYALLTVFGLAPEDDDGQAAKPTWGGAKAAQGPQNAHRRAEAPDPLTLAKKRFMKALTGHCNAHGLDKNAELELLGGNQFLSQQGVDWFEAKADYYEAN